jgi:para-aminobenzoate synthetase/4-amino-4-deoxychorismate lyase
LGDARRFDVVLRTPWGGPWRAFREPAAVLTATSAADVRACLTEIDRAVRDRGYYAAGFVTYEAASAFGLPTHPAPDGDLPLLAFGLYEPDRVTAHARPRPTAPCATGAWTPAIDHDTYLAAVAAIKRRIEAGDTYQINFTFRLRASFSGDPLALLAQLDAAQGGAWGAIVDAGRHVICSASPELFYALNGGRIRCRPMKGTAARGLWPEADLRAAAALQASAKNRAENVMIVDMVRNDLGRLARVGSVAATSLFDVERYPRQWQMTSTVTAETKTTSLAEIFEAMFPSGSVTGAPKHSSMSIIRELERDPRGVYTGAIGYVSPNRRSHFNVAIRTVVIDRERAQAEFGAGSGIVWDSVDRDEYEECLLKASVAIAGDQRSAPFQLLESIGYAPDEGFRVLAQHMARLRASAEYFGYPCDLSALRALLDDAVADLPGPSKIRVLLSRDGSFSCEAVDLDVSGKAPAGRAYRCALAAEPIDPAGVFLYHKTTRREVYEQARASRPDADAVILWNAAGEVTEATESNVVVEVDGVRVTPPVECGLLAGTFRAALLAAGELRERRVSLDELRAAPRFWLINSVRGWMDAELIGPSPPSA